MHWQLNRIMFPVYNLGVGRRLAIWVQGCSIRCTGCINPELWNNESGKLVDVATFSDGILKLSGFFNGITITGGEPFDQYEALISFCSFLKLKSNTDIFVYTGYEPDKLIQKFPDQLFTQCINRIMAGPYIMAKHENKNARGSSNQNLIKFEPETSNINLGLSNEVKFVNEDIPVTNNTWCINVDDHHQVFMSGIPGKNDLSNLQKKLIESGIKLEI